MNQKFEIGIVFASGLAILFAGCQTPIGSNSAESQPIPLNSLQSYQAPIGFDAEQNADPAGPTVESRNASAKPEASKPAVAADRPATGNDVVFRGQGYDYNQVPGTSEGPNGYPQQPVRPSKGTGTQVAFQDPGFPNQELAPTVDDPNRFPGNSRVQPPATPPGQPVNPNVFSPQNQTFQQGNYGNYPYAPPMGQPGMLPPGSEQLGLGQPFITPPGIQDGNLADLDIFVREGQTGQFMIGAGINSDAGLTGQLTISERNFDIFRFPRNFAEITNGEAFRGRGQSFRLEALPGTELQRYLVSFGEPYFYMFGQPFSFNTSGYYFTRGYFDWNEQRLGGTVSLGYRLTQDVSLNVTGRAEEVTIFNPRLNTSSDLNAVLGDNELYSVAVSLTHDTRDHPFLSSQGHFLSLSYQQAFGNFDYPRGDLEYRKYWLLSMRPDGSGKQTISHSTRLGVTGGQTPVFENYYAGGFSTMRGFDFRGASPVQNGVIVGGEFQWLNTLEYVFPITADDMFRGVLFCDYGTVEDSVTVTEENFRVVPGFGFRVNLPIGGAGGAPLAFDFGFPVASANTDDERIFSFYMAVLR